MGTQNLGRVFGYSAYEVAVQKGFVGTEAEWLQSLKQPALDAASTANSAASNANTKAALAATATTDANNATAAANSAATAANTAAANAKADMVRTSSTSNSIGMGSKTFGYIASPNIGWGVGTRLRAFNSAGNYMGGVVTAVSGTSVTILVDYIVGSGTYTSWTLGVAGDSGTNGSATISAWSATSFLTGALVSHLGRFWRATGNTISTDVPGTASVWTEELISYRSSFQIEVSTSTTALESWNNKVIVVTANSLITIPSTLSANWSCRVIVLAGYVRLAVTSPKTFYYGTPVAGIEAPSDFTISQRGSTDSIAVNGSIISKPFSAYFETTRTLAGGSLDNQVKLPFNSGNFSPVVVDWGDGTVEDIPSYNDAKTTHTYALKGEYLVKIYGRSYEMPFSSGSLERLKIKEVLSFGNIRLIGGNFFQCTNLTMDRVSDVPSNLPVGMIQPFLGCSKLVTVNNLQLWNLSGNIQQFFASAALYNQDIGGLKTDNVTNMQYMFSGATAFNQNIGSWNVSNVTNFTSFMDTKTPSTFSAANLDAIYNGWTSRALQPSLAISFGTAKYTVGASASRALLTRTNASVSVSGAVSNGGLIRITATAHGRSTGDKVFISGVTGTTEANGAWIVTVIDANTIDLQGSAFANAYVSGGSVRTGYGWTITDGGI